MEDLNFELNEHEFIELNSLLKVMGMVNSGGEAKMMIKEGAVVVDGKVEYRLRNKLRSGAIVEYAGVKVTIV